METQSEILDLISEEGQKQKIADLYESEYRHRQLVNNVAAAIYTCDANGYIKSYNKAAADLWGREPEIGKDLWCGSWKIFETDGITPLPLDSCPMAVTLKEGRSVRGKEIMVERPDGRRRNVMPYPDPIFDSAGNLVEAVNLLVDITDLKQKEYALQQSQEQYKLIAEELEKRVAARTKELAEANLQLQRTNKELEQFAFIASHDMQEPLRKIKNFATRLAHKTKDTLDEVSVSYLDKIKSSSERMTRLINDILNYSRLLDLDEQFEKTDLNEVLDEVLDDFELGIEQKKAIIMHTPLPTLKAIPLQMNQLLHNIIGNGLKFCKDDTPCELNITSRVITQKGISDRKLDAGLSYYEIVFKDNGIGFKQEYADRIFKIFERLHGRDKYEGTGIGLALCRKIMDIHRGDIFVISEINEGTAVHVILPVA
jgi:signal transduction histidine kinase